MLGWGTASKGRRSSRAEREHNPYSLALPDGEQALFARRASGGGGGCVMFATKRRSEAASAEANRLIYEMEQEFDLMRLKARRADLEREEARLAEEEELLKDGLNPQKNFCTGQLCETPTGTTWVRRLWRALARMKTIWWLEVR